MKKLISFLGTVSLIAIGTSRIVVCGCEPSKINNKFNLDSIDFIVLTKINLNKNINSNSNKEEILNELNFKKIEVLNELKELNSNIPKNLTEDDFIFLKIKDILKTQSGGYIIMIIITGQKNATGETEI